MKNLKPNDVPVIEAIEETNSVIPHFDDTGLDKTDAQKTLELFTSAFEELAKWEKYERDIKVETVDDVEQMQDAKFVRKQVVSIRTRSNDIKALAKKSLLIKERYIDSIYNTIKSLCESIEYRAEEKEKFVENLMREKRQRIYAERSALLIELQYNFAHLDLINMPDETFDQIYEDAKDLKALKDQRAKEQELEQEKEMERQKLERFKLERKSLRADRLINMGFITSEDYAEMTDQEFEALMDHLKKQKAKELERKIKIDKRKQQLFELGYRQVFDKQKSGYLFTSNYPYEMSSAKLIASSFVYLTEVEQLSDSSWRSKFKTLKDEYDQIIKQDEVKRKQLEEQKQNEERGRKRLAEIKIAREAQLKLLHPDTYDKKIDVTLFSESDWSKLITQLNELSVKLRNEQMARLEQERKQNLSDSQAIREYFDGILSIPVPTPSSTTLLKTIQSFRNDIISKTNQIISTLNSDVS